MEYIALEKLNFLNFVLLIRKNYIIYKNGFNIINDNNYILITLDDIYSKLD